jgi:EAL domain-containing protein (putative c-di-GMP-specific phosphodiesterase class I)
MLKIDGQFVRDIHRDANNQVLAQALVSIGQHFDMLTVAEAVEDAGEAAWLAEIGIDCLQGFYFGAPLRLGPLGTVRGNNRVTAQARRPPRGSGRHARVAAWPPGGLG